MASTQLGSKNSLKSTSADKVAEVNLFELPEI